MYCSRTSEFLKEERNALKEEFNKRRQELEIQYGRNVSGKEAEINFLEDGLEGFAEGFRMGFCAQCGEKDECRNGE